MQDGDTDADVLQGSTVWLTITNATVTCALTSLFGAVSTAADRSVVGRSVTALKRSVRNSRLYRWATYEPDDQITINLNDAVLGTPVAKALVLLTGTLPKAVRASATTRYYRTAESVFLAAPLRFLGMGLFVVGSLGVAATLTPNSVLRGETVGYAALATVGMLVSRVRTPWRTLSNATVVQLWRRGQEPDD